MIHVLPLNDERKHDLTADCWCRPRIEWQDQTTGEIYAEGPIITHNAADCREVAEWVTGESMAPGKGWTVIKI